MSESLPWDAELNALCSPEKNAHWWDVCYVELPAQVTLRGVDRSVVVVGGPKSGKTTALRAFERAEQERLFLVWYPLDRWYGEANAWLAGEGNHLSQIMACAAVKVRNFISRNPEKLKELTPLNLEYLRWLVKKHSARRTFSRWADSLAYSPLLQLVNKPFEDIYPDATALHDAQGQIEELVTLSRRLDFDGVAVLVDLPPSTAETRPHPGKVADFFSWLVPLQIQGFALKAGIPQAMVEQTDLPVLVRDRVTFTFIEWRLDDFLRLADKYVAIATRGQRQTLASLVDPALQNIIVEHLQELYSHMLPEIWLKLVQVLLKNSEQGQVLKATDADVILHTYYANYVPLKFDEVERGVWRGKQCIKLDPQPFEFFKILWQYRNSLDDPDRALLNLAGGKRGNMNTIASRLRNKIEPAPKLPVYIRNNRSRGYWLENAIKAEGT